MCYTYMYIYIHIYSLMSSMGTVICAIFFHKIITFCPNEQNRLRFFIFLSVWYFLHFIKKYSHKHAFLFEVFCTDIISMQPAVHMDSLSFDHIDFDVKLSEELMLLYSQHELHPYSSRHFSYFCCIV